MADNHFELTVRIVIPKKGFLDSIGDVDDLCTERGWKVLGSDIVECDEDGERSVKGRNAVLDMDARERAPRVAEQARKIREARAERRARREVP